MLKARKRFFRGFPVYEPPSTRSAGRFYVSAWAPDHQNPPAERQLAAVGQEKPFPAAAQPEGISTLAKRIRLLPSGVQPVNPPTPHQCFSESPCFGRAAIASEPRPDATGAAGREGAGAGADSLIHEGIEGNVAPARFSGRFGGRHERTTT